MKISLSFTSIFVHTDGQMDRNANVHRTTAKDCFESYKIQTFKGYNPLTMGGGGYKHSSLQFDFRILQNTCIVLRGPVLGECPSVEKQCYTSHCVVLLARLGTGWSTGVPGESVSHIESRLGFISFCSWRVTCWKRLQSVHLVSALQASCELRSPFKFCHCLFSAVSSVATLLTANHCPLCCLGLHTFQATECEVRLQGGTAFFGKTECGRNEQ
jgi:hypothetical protein